MEKRPLEGYRKLLGVSVLIVCATIALLAKSITSEMWLQVCETVFGLFVVGNAVEHHTTTKLRIVKQENSPEN